MVIRTLNLENNTNGRIGRWMHRFSLNSRDSETEDQQESLLSFADRLDASDQRENIRREVEEHRISQLPPAQQAAVMYRETAQQQQYDERRAQILQDYYGERTNTEVIDTFDSGVIPQAYNAPTPGYSRDATPDSELSPVSRRSTASWGGDSQIVSPSMKIRTELC